MAHTKNIYMDKYPTGQRKNPEIGLWGDIPTGVAGPHLTPLFGQQDEAVVVNQEAAEILHRKEQKEKCVLRNTKADL